MSKEASSSKGASRALWHGDKTVARGASLGSTGKGGSHGSAALQKSSRCHRAVFPASLSTSAFSTIASVLVQV